MGRESLRHFVSCNFFIKLDLISFLSEDLLNASSLDESLVKPTSLAIISELGGRLMEQLDRMCDGVPMSPNLVPVTR